MTKAIIYKPTKNAMQSGPGGRASQWLLEYLPHTNPHFIEPLMGWTGGIDTTRQTKISFDSMQAAVKYAENHNIPYETVQAKKCRKAPKSYADNFRHNKAQA